MWGLGAVYSVLFIAVVVAAVVDVVVDVRERQVGLPHLLWRHFHIIQAYTHTHILRPTHMCSSTQRSAGVDNGGGTYIGGMSKVFMFWIFCYSILLLIKSCVLSMRSRYVFALKNCSNLSHRVSYKLKVRCVEYGTGNK